MKNFVNIVEMLQMADGAYDMSHCGATVSKSSSIEQIVEAVVSSLNEIDIYSEEDHDNWNHEFVEKERDFNVFSKEDFSTVIDLIVDFASKTKTHEKTFWFA